MASEAPLTIGMVVPSDRLGSIIGKAGAGLRAAREGSGGCKLDVDNNADASSPTRRVNLSGDVNQIAAAFQMVAQKAYQDESHGLPTLLIPADRAGAVVGKGGDNLKAVRQGCGVAVKVEREPVIDHATGNQERLMTLQGEGARLGQALALALGGATASMPAAVGGYPAYGAMHGGGMSMSAQVMASPAGQQGLQQVRAPSDDPNHMQLHLYINPKYVGAIVGKEGATIKQTGASTGTSCSVTKRDSGDRRVVIQGTYHDCVAAQNVLVDQMAAAAKEGGEQPDAEVKVIQFIRKETAGAVIGKQGSQLTQIREQSACKIQVDKEEVQGQRPCTITGALQSVVTAQKMIADIVRGDMEKRPLPEMGDPSLPPAKRARVEGDCRETKILIPKELAGAVIGKQGANLKHFREVYGVNVKMFKTEEAPQWPQERVVVVSGEPSSREGAVIAILGTAFANELSSVVLKLLIPKDKCGAVLGKGGQNLSSIRQSAGVHTQLEREEIMGERLLHTMGSQTQVNVVVQMVVAFMSGHEPASQPPPAPPPMEYAGGGFGMDYGYYAPPVYGQQAYY